MNDNFDYKEVPSTYLHCIHTQCPRSAECLYFQVTLHVDRDTPFFPVINIGHVSGREDKCPYFQHDSKTCFAVGITHLFDHIPHAKAVRIRKIIYGYFERNMYYRIRNKQRYIKPEEQEFIRKIFRKEGIQEEPAFDEFVYQYDW